METIEPVIRTVSVHSRVDAAVTAFTERIGDWWPLNGHTVGEDRVAAIVFEPAEGGRLYERWHDGGEADWGRVLTWDPPGQIVFTWQPDPDAPAATEVELRFEEASPTVTRVRLEHRGWERLGDAGHAERAQYDEGWAAVIRRYVAGATDPLAHRAFAVDAHQQTWLLLEQADRTPAEDERMVHTAHASAYHWGVVGDALNHTRGEWLVGRVYTVLGRAEPARHHARLALAICEEHGLGDFDLAYAYEGVARAEALGGDAGEARRHRDLAAEAAAAIADPEDRIWFEGDLAAGPWFGVEP